MQEIKTKPTIADMIPYKGFTAPDGGEYEYDGNGAPCKGDVFFATSSDFVSRCDSKAIRWNHVGFGGDITFYMPAELWEQGFKGIELTGEIPEDAVGKEVEIVMRDGDRERGFSDQFDWSDGEGWCGDVIAYRIIEDGVKYQEGNEVSNKCGDNYPIGTAEELGADFLTELLKKRESPQPLSMNLPDYNFTKSTVENTPGDIFTQLKQIEAQIHLNRDSFTNLVDRKRDLLEKINTMLPDGYEVSKVGEF
jgi:hypothetical protein